MSADPGAVVRGPHIAELWRRQRAASPEPKDAEHIDHALAGGYREPTLESITDLELAGLIAHRAREAAERMAPVLSAALEVARTEYVLRLDTGQCQVCERRKCKPTCLMWRYEQACLAAGVSPIDGWKLEDCAPIYPAVLCDILAERVAQDVQWGGAVHDDEREPFEWLWLIRKQVDAAFGARGRGRLIKIAALAIAAVESLDRKGGST